MLIAVLRELVPVLLCLYVADCFALVHAGDFILASHAGGPLRALTRRVGFTAALPEGKSFWVPRVPALLGASGAFLPMTEATGPRRFVSSSYTFVPYDALRNAAVNGSLILAGPCSIRSSSPTVARRTAQALSSIATTSSSKRGAAVLALVRGESDTASIRRRRRTLLAEAHGLRVPGWFLFALLFIAFPASAYVGPLADRAPFVLLAFAAVYAVQLILSILSKRRLRSQGIPTPPGVIASLVMSPPSAARAAINLVRSGFEGFDPLTVASILLPGPRFAPLLVAEKHGSLVALTEDAGPEWHAYWSSRLAHCEGLASRVTGRRRAAALPSQLDSQSVGVCAFCRSEYTDPSVARCDDCDFPLMKFAPGPSQAPPQSHQD